MTNPCNFLRSDEGWRCRECGRLVRSRADVRPLAVCGAANPSGVSAKHRPSNSSGPGTELKAILRDWLGIQASPNCSCNARARAMDEKGSDWCEANVGEIVGWLREEATKRGLPFVDMAGRLLIKRAIRNARRTATPTA